MRLYTKRAKPVDLWGIKERGVLLHDMVWDFTDQGRKDAIECANKPAGQSVVRCRLSEYAKPRRKAKP